ncbi:polyketide synthase regulator [Enemella evansiae]|uniref:helix-turn-helix domain-containing protein n=1 Tax=Enemella evansiae TaxID=2016499 RepID=UPI000B967108|nr:helix-turn-helix domain-containing protein [Enemella evansiae]OYN96207.1 polyketide synthase regulator [Enemella evansiae]
MTALDLAALQAHLANGGVRHVAGPSDTEFAAARLAHTDADLDTQSGDDLAIIATAAPVEPWRVDALLRRVRERGYTGLAMPGAAGVSPGATRLADRLDLTLLEVERPYELAEACWQLTLARDALTLEIVRRLAVAFRYQARDLPDLLTQLAASVGQGIALVDAAGVLVEAGGQLGESHRAIGWDSWIDLAHDGDTAIASVRVDSLSRPGLRLAIFGDGISRPQLLALSVAAEVAMPAVAARILVDEVAAVSDASVSSDLLRDFLDLRGVPDPEVERRMLERGWRTDGHHLGFRLLGRSRVDTRELLRLVSTELARLGVESHATTLGRGVTGWLRFPTSPDAATLERRIGALRGVLESARRAFNVAMGVGSLQPGGQGLGLTLGEATDAARIAVDRSSTGWFVRVDGLGLEQLLLARTDDDTFMPAAESLLEPLRGDGDVLLSTLAAYLDQESSIAATAEALGVHRNTVTSRVQRIQGTLGVDLHDPGVRLALHLACRAVLR